MSSHHRKCCCFVHISMPKCRNWTLKTTWAAWGASPWSPKVHHVVWAPWQGLPCLFLAFSRSIVTENANNPYHIAWQTFGHAGGVRPRQASRATICKSARKIMFVFFCMLGQQLVQSDHLVAIWPCFVLAVHKKQASGQSAVVAHSKHLGM